MTTVRHRRLPAALAGLLGLALAAGTLAAPAQADTTYVDEPGGERVTYASSNPDDPADAWATYLRLMTIPSRANDFKPVSKAPGPGTGACPPRRCRDISVPVPAGVKVDSNKARVILPVGYFAKKNRTRRYPVVGATPEGGRRAELEGDGKDGAAVVVGVLADEVDPPGRPGRARVPPTGGHASQQRGPRDLDHAASFGPG